MRKMTALLYKDLRIFKNSLLLLFGTDIFMLLIFPTYLYHINDNKEDFTFFFSLMSIFLVAMVWLITQLVTGAALFQADERKSWANFMLSLPDGNNAQIRTKYEFALILELVTFLLTTFSTTIYQAVFDAGIAANSISFVLFFLTLLLNAFSYPAIIRFGSQNSVNIMMIPFFAFVFAVGVYFLFADLSWMPSSDDFFDYIFSLLRGERKLTLLSWITAILPYASVGAYVLSYHISCKLYRKGVANYVK